ncbi:B3/4 domain-containing protein [Acetomicrobium mobile]|uniref:B3/B4 domain-containing protein n=1 Tax=Acetomicrobium mobile TaxID=97477 RepID=UPI0026F0A71E|nr:phenylalanine--tRNA ligase beta subunit-related protein [Acetomicrobium mobile]
MRRVIKGESLRNVSSVVDCYNCVSVMTLLPMGAYDAYKLKGGLTLRYGKEGEIFLPLGSGEEITVKDTHIVYADEEKICCWLWNHRDSRLCAVTTDTKRRTFSSFFVDAADESGAPDVEKALDLFAGHLEAIGCKVHLTSIPL